MLCARPCGDENTGLSVIFHAAEVKKVGKLDETVEALDQKVGLSSWVVTGTD